MAALFLADIADIAENPARVVRQSFRGKDDKPSLFGAGAELYHTELRPGEGLDKLSRAAVHKLALSMGALEERGSA